MKALPKVKVWTGDGFGASDPVILTQIKRNDKAAIYSRHRQRSPEKLEGYEVFRIKVIKEGASLPGGGKVEEAYESYPSANAFGRWAWSLGTNLKRAEELFDELSSEHDAAEPSPDEVEPGSISPVKQGQGRRGRPKKAQGPVTLPKGEFTMQQIADLNKMDKPNMYIVVREFIAQGKVVEVRRESRGKGRPTVIYATK